MRFKNLTLATAAIVGALGLAGVAAAAIHNSHVMTVELPDGATAHIRYFGDTPPEVRVEPAQAVTPLALTAPVPVLLDPEFARVEQVMAEMDRQAATMLTQTEQLMRAAPSGSGLMQANLGALPEGASGYSVVSTLTPHGVCTQSVEYRATDHGQPQVVRRTSGDCGDAIPHEGVLSSSPQSAPRLTAVAYRPAS